jgi:hypothetical protein
MSPTAKDEEAGIDGDGDQRESGSITPNAPRFTLDSPIEVEGSNLSIGPAFSGVPCARAGQRQQNPDPRRGYCFC